jgi:glycosyltransferase involved in cell wall biosynthesis
MRIAVLAPYLGGHRAHWLERIVLDSKSAGINVLVYTSDTTQRDRIINELHLTYEDFVFDVNTSEIIRRWRNDVKSQSLVGISYEADKLLPKLLFAKGKMQLLIMRPYLEEGSVLGVIRFISKQLIIFILSLKRSVTISRLSIPYSRLRSRNFGWLRDNYNTEHFFNSTNCAKIPRELLEISGDTKIVTLGGYLDARKNPREAYSKIEALRDARDEKIYLIFAGTQTEDFKAELSKIGNLKDVIQIERSFSDDELMGLLLKSDLIFLPYKNRGASGMVLNSLTVGTPVFLYGSHNWRRLQGLLGGQLIVGNQNSRELITQLSLLLDRPKKSMLLTLREEKIPSLSDFLLCNLK